MEIFNYIKKNNLVELKKYLQFGNINIINEESKSLLHYAVIHSAFDCVNYLIDNYIDLNLVDNNNQTPIFEAAKRGRIGLVKILLRNKCDVNIQDKFGNTPLFYAIQTNNFAVVDLLYTVSDLTIRNHKLETPLMVAIQYNYEDIDKFELDLYDKNCSNDSVFHYAVKVNNLKFLKKYMSREFINYKNNYSESVFFYAVKYSNCDIVSFLLTFLPCLDVTNKFEERLIDVVSFANKYLIENYTYTDEYMYYKVKFAHIHNYIISGELTKVTKNNINKKDKFNLSLIDYIKFNNDVESLKKVKSLT